MTPDLYAGQVNALAVLANGIVPSDEKDAGAAAVNAAPRIAEKIAAGINAALYVKGLSLAETMAKLKYDCEVTGLGAAEVHELLAVLRDKSPEFFKQLRVDVAAMYLSKPTVWERIGFPGPSIASGGYADFDQPQTHKISTLKEVS